MGIPAGQRQIANTRNDCRQPEHPNTAAGAWTFLSAATPGRRSGLSARLFTSNAAADRNVRAPNLASVWSCACRQRFANQLQACCWRVTSALLARDSGVAIVFASYSLGVLLVFSWCFPRFSPLSSRDAFAAFNLSSRRKCGLIPRSIRRVASIACSTSALNSRRRLQVPGGLHLPAQQAKVGLLVAGEVFLLRVPDELAVEVQGDLAEVTE